MAFALTKLAGALYLDPRPFVAHHFLPLIPHEVDNGFPSDHTVLSMLIALTVCHFSIEMGWVLTGLALLVGVARVLCGIHNPIDIVGAVLIAVLASIISSQFLKRISPDGMADK